MLIQELTDDVIRNDPLFLAVIERNLGLLEEIGWQDASLVEQYNIINYSRRLCGGVNER